MLAIKMSKVSKHYGRAMALDAVSLAVETGEIYGFLGPNGAGKTTSIRCIMDFIRPNAGAITIFGLDTRRDSVAVKRQVGFLSAENQLYEKWTAQQHIAFIAGVRGGVQTSDKLMKRLDLDPNVQVRRMSTGNKQKLGLVLALMYTPKLLILDEPTTGLDPLLQHEIHTMLQEFVSGGGTVFLSSHNLSEVERICTNVGVIRKGHIVASQSMSEILAMNVHIITATFGADSMTPHFTVPGAEVVSVGDGHIVLKIRGDINPALAAITAHTLADLEVTHAPLEEIFMEYYRDQP